MTIRATTTFVLILSACILIGCGDDDKPTESKTGVPDELVGTWIFQSASVGGMPMGLENFIPWEQNTVSARMTVTADGSFVVDNIAADSTVFNESSGTFTVNGNSFAITDNAEFPYSGNWAVDGTELTLSAEIGGYQLVIIATR
jgi:hypothetical protein